MTDFASFQNEIYFAGLGDQLPELPVTYDGLRALAREVLDDRAYGYVAGSASSEDTAVENRRAFERWRLVPRMARDVSQTDLSVELFGQRFPAPVLLGPVGVLSIIHDDAEKAVARAASGLGVPFVLSTVSAFPIEEVAEAAGDGPRWFQLYWPNDRELAASLVGRAEEAGYTAIVVTLDTKLLAWRPRDLAQAYLPFIRGEGLSNYRTDPVFTASLDENIEDREQATILRWIQLFPHAFLRWEDIAWLRDQTDLPIVVKGVLHPDDARAAIDAGADGILVSNHGGRQVDGAIASLDALPGVVEAAGDVPVLLDSGVRTGADVVKAVALGARAVLLGRPYVWGLAVAGEEGVRHALRCVLADLDLTVRLSGFTSLGEIGPDVLVRQP